MLCVNPTCKALMTTAFCHLASEVGSLDYLVFTEIRRCLDLKRGGVNHEGEHWVYKSAQEIADLLGVARNTAAKALRRLADRGLVARQKLGVAVGHITNRAWYYCLGEDTPDFVRKRQSNATRRTGAMDCARVAQSNSSTTLTKNHSKPERPQTEQPTAEHRDAIQLARAIAEGKQALSTGRDRDGFLIQGIEAQEPAGEAQKAIEQPDRAQLLNPLQGLLGGVLKDIRGFGS